MQSLQVEGKEILKDFSYEWVQGHADLIAIERGIQIAHFTEEMQKRDLEMEFRLLRRLTETQYHNDNLFDFHPDILKLNRYNNILPYKHSIVRLQFDGDEEDSHKEAYINANFMNLINGKEKMIVATQGPLLSTFTHFWRMIIQENLSVIIMLCNLRENQKSQCEQYWPKNVGESLLCGNITVRLETQEDMGNQIYKRTMTVVDDIQERVVTQYQWLGWQDQGAPAYSDYDIVAQLLNLIVEQLEKDYKVVFHCSAGVGRTGTLIALSNLMILLKTYKNHIGNEPNKIEDNADLYRVSIFGTVRRLREQRWGMVHTSEQYIYIYKFMDQAIKQLFPMQ